MRHLLALALILGGCNAQRTATPGCYEEDVLRVPAATTAHIDVFFVVDDSPAMAPFQARLETTLPPELAHVIETWTQPASWHVGVISADLSDRAVRWIDGSQVGAELATLLHHDDTGGDVEPLEAAYRALRDGPASAAGFLRNDAGLAVIFISASDDASPFDLSRYVRFLTTPAAQGGIKVDPYDVVLLTIAPTTAMRLRAVVDAAHTHADVDIVSPDWQAALTSLEPTIETELGPPCTNQLIPDPTRPDCVAVDVTAFPDGTTIQRILPPCSAGVTDCWQLVPDPRCTPLRLDIVRSSDAPASTTTTFECSHPCS